PPLAPADDRPLVGAAARRGSGGLTVARAARRRERGGALERPGARAAHARARPARTGHPRVAAGLRGDARAPRTRRLVALPRRGAAGSDPRCRDRQHVDGRDALARAGLTVATPSRRDAREAAPRAR